MVGVLKQFLGALVLALLTTPGAFAGGPDAFCTRPLRVAMLEYGVLYRSAVNDGIDSRVLDLLEKRSGCALERVVMPRARIWAELQSGSLDMATAALPTPERKAYAYLLPYMQTRNLVLVRRDRAPEGFSRKAFEASALRLGVVRGFRYESSYDALVATVAARGGVVEAVDVTELFRMLDGGMVDVVLSQPVVFPQYISANKLAKEVRIFDWAPQNQFAVGAMILSRKSFTDAQAKHWDDLILDAKRDGSLRKIMHEFLPAKLAKEVAYTGPRTPD